MNAPSAALHVRESGQPGSPAIVFLHATGASGGMWEQHLQRLGGYHCLAPDLPGHGRSNHLPWRSRIDIAEHGSPRTRPVRTLPVECLVE